MNNKRPENDIINWYKKQLNIGKNINQKLGWPKKKGFKKRYQIMSEIIKFNKKKISVLDFGCGFSLLYKYYLNKKKINYTGVDAIEYFIEYSQKKYPHNKYLKLNNDNIKQLKKYDYVFLNGILTVRRNVNNKNMYLYTKRVLTKLFKKTNIGLAVNFMSTNVDWKRNDLFHLSLDKLTKFITKDLSKKFIIRNDYGLYEYTIYIFKK